MVLLEKLWDDVKAGPKPDRGLGKLRKLNTQPTLNKDGSNNNQRPISTPISPIMVTNATTSSSPTAVPKDNVWRSVFNPGSNLNTKAIGAEVFDKPQPNSPTGYDWLYSTETRSKHR